MKILHVTPAYEPAWHLGGVVRSVSQFCRGLASLGHDVTVFTTNFGSDRGDVPVNRLVNVGGVKVFYFKTDFNNFGYSSSLRKACRQFIADYDITHITSLWWYPEIAAGIQAIKHRVPYIVSPAGALTLYSLSQKALKKFIYLKFIGRRIINNARAIHYKTQMEREQSAHLGIHVSSCVVPNAFSIDEFRELPDKYIARKNLNIPLENQVILFLGRLHVVKSLDILIKAVAKVKNQFENITLVIAGPDGGQLDALRGLATDLGIGSKVLFPGSIPPHQRNILLRTADLLTLVSFHENFGNAAVEAMLAGVPVLLSDNVGICREVAADGAGLSVDLNEAAIARGLREMLGNPERLAAMGQAAWEASRRRYDIKVVAKQMATAYQDILTGKRSPGLSWSDAPSGPRE